MSAITFCLICLSKSKATISFPGTSRIKDKITSSRQPKPPFGMALREMPLTLCRLTTRAARPVFTAPALSSRRYASSEAASTPDAAADLQDLESQNSFTVSEYPSEKIKAFDPIKRAQGRTRELPPSRYDTNGPQKIRRRTLLILLATNIGLPDTIEVLFTPTSLRQPPTPRPESLFPAPSRKPVSSRHTNLPSPRIS
jgi:hypothetical protein